MPQRSFAACCRGLGLLAALGLLGVPAASAEDVPADEDVFRSWISPVTSPTNFEDPRATTEVRPIFVYHMLSGSFVSDGGEVYIGAVQARAALTDRLSIIATKDGYVWRQPDSGLPDTKGWANLAFGAKYSVWRDPETETIGTVGLRYEAPTGNNEIFEGQGDGMLNPFISVGGAIGDLHLMGYTGPRLAISHQDSSFYDLSLHADYKLGMFYPLLELNWVHVLDGGQRLPINQEGFDFFNFGSQFAGGDDYVTMSVGGRIRLWDDIEWFSGRFGSVDFGAAYEFPLTSDGGVFGSRLTSDFVIRFW